jgi:5'(3')-deoxyribonucleotidase
MTRKSIAIDLDDVLAAHVEAFIAFSNAHYDTNLTVDDYSDYWASLWHVDDEEIERRAVEFHVPESVAGYAVKEEAIVALQKLHKNYDLYIVTARAKALLAITQKWIDKYFPGIFAGVHFVPIWEPNNKITKADICNQIGATYLIDDLPRHCNVAAESGLTAILFGDYAWNRHEPLDEGVIRCKTWDEIVDYFVTP